MIPTLDNETLSTTSQTIFPWGRLPVIGDSIEIDNQPVDSVDYGPSDSTFRNVWYVNFDVLGSSQIEPSTLRPRMLSTVLPSIVQVFHQAPETMRSPRNRSATSPFPNYRFLFPVEEFQHICAEARDEVFEHGMESVFSLSLASFIESYQELAIHIISRIVASGSVDKVVAMEILRQMGLSEHEPTYDSRLSLLLQHLKSDLVMVRYGAMYGLSSMDDPNVIPEIEHACKQETDPYLQKYMRATLEQLRDTLSEA